MFIIIWDVHQFIFYCLFPGLDDVFSIKLNFTECFHEQPEEYDDGGGETDEQQQQENPKENKQVIKIDCLSSS